MKRFITAALAAVLAVGGLVIIAPAASAHHTTVSATAVQCGTTTGTYKITWKVQNWNGGVSGAVTSSSRSVVPNGTRFTSDQSKTFTETVNSKASVSLSVTFRWDNGETATNSGSADVNLFPDCTQHVTATAPAISDPTCATDGTLTVPADTAEINYSQSPNGSGPGTYTITATAKSGYAIDGTKSWTKTVLPKLTGDQCLTSVTPVAPAVDKITECGEYGSLTFASTEGVSYALTEGDGKQGAYKVIATVKPGYKLANGAQTVFAGDLGKRTECVTPAAPTQTSPSCEEGGTLVIPTTPGVKYATADLGDNKVKVTATAEEGYTIDGDSEWIITLDPKNTGTECDKAVTPEAPAVTVIDECGEIGSISYKATEGITYVLTEGDGKQGAYKVVATAKPGYKIADGAQTVFAGNLGTQTTCATPVAPTVDAIDTCDEDGSITFATTEGVDYALTDGNGKAGVWTVTATAKPGYEFADHTQTVFTGDLGERTTCATPEPPTKTDATCDAPGTVKVAETEGVKYVVADLGNDTYTVTAEAEAGYTLEGDSEWTFTVDPKKTGDKDSCGTPVDPGTEKPASAKTAITPTNAVLPATGAPAGTLVMVMLGMAFLAIGAVTVTRRRTHTE